MGAFICSKRYSDLRGILNIAYFKSFDLLSYKDDSIWGIFGALMRGEAILDTEHLKKVVRQEIGDITFKEIHDKFKWNLNITVTDS
jgi:hypothetical protein